MRWKLSEFAFLPMALGLAAVCVAVLGPVLPTQAESRYSDRIYADSFGNLVVHSRSGYKRIVVGKGYMARELAEYERPYDRNDVIYMNEGDVFNTEALKMSIKRINQLGYFKQMESAPDIQPSQDADNKVDVTFKVEEQNRNQFTFGGGVSGYEGTFINASFSTTNFLGAGETFQIYVQSGSRTKNYSLSVSEPYFLDRPITAGADIFKRKITYYSYANVTGYTQESTGMSLVTGFLLGKWSRAFLNYTYEVIKLSEADPADVTNPFFPGLGGGNVISVPNYDPLLFGDTANRTESRLTPNLVYNTVDNPYSPRAGMRHTASIMFAGGPLGGTVNYYRPSLEAIFYKPVGRRMALGVRAEWATIQ